MKVHASKSNVQRLANKALALGFNGQQAAAYIKAHLMTYDVPEDKPVRYQIAYVKAMGGVTIGEFDAIMKETFNK